jgi:hypothetical protein
VRIIKNLFKSTAGYFASHHIFACSNIFAIINGDRKNLNGVTVAAVAHIIIVFKGCSGVTDNQADWESDICTVSSTKEVFLHFPAKNKTYQ